MAFVRRLFALALRALRLVFILMLVALPLPIATFIVSMLGPSRRNNPAQVLRKR
jgi:hypothetical protein